MLNIFFIDDPSNTGGAVGWANYVLGTFNNIGWGFGSFSEILSHELGHSLGGLKHPEGTGGGGNLTPDAIEPLGLSSGLCGTLNTSNNIMSNQNYQCRNYLSPMQIANFSVTACQNGNINTNLGVNYNNLGYTDFCDYDATKSAAITSDETWTLPRNIKGDIIINSGVHLTIKCNVNMTKNSRVIVKVGGKLTVDGGTLTNRCLELWQGVDVRGDATKPQTVGSNGMPLYQGMLEIINFGAVQNAVTGARSSSFLGGGGGIIQCKDAFFTDNKIDALLDWYVYVDPAKPYKSISNESFFKNTSFTSSLTLIDGSNKLKNIDLYKVRNVAISGCSFSNNSGQQAINCIDASFIANDYCTNSPTCSSLIRNTFSSNCDYYIYVKNSINFFPSIIDHASLGNLCKKTYIYIAGGNYSSVVNCNFDIVDYTTYPSPKNITGVYLDNTTGFVAENNIFFGYTGTTNLNLGLIVNNSGPFANSVYNNQFKNLDQGLWAQNQNVDFSNGVGLKMNCNDFTNCDYNIGIQKSGRFTTLTNNTGVAFSQGVAGGLDIKNVRNTYSATPSCTNENKYYVNTSNALNIIHGSFNAFASYGINDLHPTPQPSCSFAGEVSVQVGIPPTTPKTAYCFAAYPPSFSNLMLNTEATLQRQTITSLTSSLTARVDGGNTQGFLNVINSGTMSAGNLKNMLATVGPYLSDEAMIAFYNTNPPYGHDKIIHEINAPVSPKVFEKILSLNLPSGVLQSIQNNQNQNALSARRFLEAQLSLEKTELGLILNEKTRRFVNDSTINPADSINSILESGEIANSDLLKVTTSIAFRDYNKASAQILALQERNGPSDFVKLYSLILQLAVDPSYFAVLALDNAKKEKLITLSNSFDPMLEGPSKAILSAVYNYYIEEEKLNPVQDNGTRFSNNKENTQVQTIYLNSSVKVYPNPAQNELYVEMENNNATTIEIRDVTSKLLKSQNIAIKGRVNIESLENGIYFVNLVSESKLISSKKIVILR